MKHSIKRQMMTAFAGLILIMIFIFFVTNGIFLEKYYVSNKETEFKKVYEKLAEGVRDGSLLHETPEGELSKLAEKNNIAIVVIDREYNKVYMNARDLQMMVNQLLGYLYNKNTQEILERTDEYSLSKSMDPRNQTEYIEMWGSFENGDIFIMRSPLESIRAAVDKFNYFSVVVGVIAVALSLVLAWYFSRRLTGPVMELATLSQRMANLDFEAKYTSGGDNEIGVLGQSFNQMSEKLEQTISNLKEANYKLQKDIEKKEKLEEMRTEFIGNVSHELKTPIALIQGYAEGLKEGISDDPESREFYCDVIVDEAAKMNRMVKNLLTLNQLELGEDEVQFERFDITALIAGVLQSMDILVSQKGAHVTFGQEKPVYVWADEFKVEQVVRNYCSNALNHVDGEMRIDIQIKEEADVARISVIFPTGKNIINIWYASAPAFGKKFPRFSR